jgi:hypothetical protein
MSAAINWVDHHLKIAKEQNNVVKGLAKLLGEFNDDDGNDEIPADVKSGYTRGHLLTAIQIITESVDGHIHELEKILKSQK